MLNGVDVSALEGAVETISDDHDVGAFTFRAETEWQNSLRSVTTIDEFDQAGETVHSRKFTLQGDEPEQILGERTGPNAVELLLGALGSCLTVGYAANAAAMGIELDDLRFEMEGGVDLRGFLGIDEAVRPGYETMTCSVYVDADATEEQLRELQRARRVHLAARGRDYERGPLETNLVVE